MLAITQYFKELGVMAHLLPEFRNNSNVGSQDGIMFIHSCGSKVHNVRKNINVHQWIDGWVGGWMDGWIGGWTEAGREREWGRENEWMKKEMKYKKNQEINNNSSS